METAGYDNFIGIRFCQIFVKGMSCQLGARQLEAKAYDLFFAAKLVVRYIIFASFFAPYCYFSILTG